MRLLIIFLLMISVLIPSVCQGAAATMYVTPAGAGDKSGSSWANAMGLTEWKTDMSNAMEPGDIYYLAGGTYTITANTEFTRDGTTANPIKIIGVKSGTTAEPPTTSDYAYGTDRPLIATGAYYFYFGTANYFIVYNLQWTTTDNYGLAFGMGSTVKNCKSTNSGAATRDAFTSPPYGVMISCEAISTNGYGIDISSPGHIINCYIHDSALGIGNESSTGAFIYGNVIDNCSTVGIEATSAPSWVVMNNTIYACTTGISGTTAYCQFFINNIITGCTTGASWTTETRSNWWGYNCWNNTTDTSNVTKGSDDITGNPLLTDPANGDFTLQTGSPCLNAGLAIGATAGVTGAYKVNIGVDQDDVSSGGGGVGSISVSTDF